MRKTKKPLLVLVSLLLIMVTALAGCGKSASSSSTTGETMMARRNRSASRGNRDGKWVLGEKPLEFSAYSHYENSDFPKWESTPVGKYLSEENK